MLRRGVLNGAVNLNMIFIINVPLFHLLTPKDIISLPKSVHVNQNGIVSRVFLHLGISLKVKYIFTINSTLRSMFSCS